MKSLDGLEKELTREVADAFTFLGEKCIKRVRQDHPNNWKDRTGNLRSSIGYRVAENQDIVSEAVAAPTNAPEGNGKDGKANAQKALDEATRALEQGKIKLVVVAGMEYASFVEAKGYDVLASTKLWAQGEAEKAVKRAVETVIERHK